MRGRVVEVRDDLAKVVEFQLKVALSEVDVVAEASERRTQLSATTQTVHACL